MISRGKEVVIFLTLKAVSQHSEAWDLITVILATAIIDSKINQLLLKPGLVLNMLTIYWGQFSWMCELSLQQLHAQNWLTAYDRRPSDANICSKPFARALGVVCALLLTCLRVVKLLYKIKPSQFSIEVWISKLRSFCFDSEH